MKEVISGIFGNYSPEIVELIGPDALPYEVIVPDYEYIAGVVLFSIVLYCSFRLIGSFFRR